MSADDAKEPPAEPLGPDGKPIQDLRYSGEASHNVRIDRQLDGSGHLARGDKTRMSVLNFSSRHQARTERDPDFEFRPAPTKPAPPPTPSPAAAAPAPPSAAGSPPPPSAAPEPPSVLGRVKKLFGW